MPNRASVSIGALLYTAVIASCALDHAPATALAHDPALAAAFFTELPHSLEPRSQPASQARSEGTASATFPIRGRRRVPRESALSPLADTIARGLVFLGRGEGWHTASVRGRRLLLDLGRVDANVKAPARRAAYLEAVTHLAPVREGDRFRIYGPWGADDAEVGGYDVWNGRIVATLRVPSRVELLLRRSDPLVAAAIRADSALAPVVDTCPRDSVDDALIARVGLVRDSLEQALRADSATLYERLQSRIRVRSSVVTGCFADARALLLVTLLAGDYEYVRESAVLVPDSGRVVPLRASDLRFRAHEAIHAFDADGDGIDDIATRGFTTRAGATVVMRLSRGAARLERLTAGFAWESF